MRAAADALLSGQTAQIARLHFAESSVNSVEKPAGFYEELTQKTAPKIVETSSVFFENGDFLRTGSATTHLQKQGTAVSELSNNLRFLIKKAANTPPETLGKFENAYLIYINFICQ